MCVFTAAAFAGSAAMATAANVGLATSLLSTGFQVMGQMQQAKAQKKNAAYQARITENNRKVSLWQAEDALKRGRIEEQQHRLKVSQLSGRQRAALAASGFDPNVGDPIDILADTAALGEYEALTIRSNAEREAYAHKVQASNLEAEGAVLTARSRQSSTAGTLGTLFSGVGSIASKWYGYSQGVRGASAPLMDDTNSFGLNFS